MGNVVAVSRSAEHAFSKVVCGSITLIEGEGVEGDAHRGVTVKHRSRVKTDPSRPNLRQVHLIHMELIEELRSKGFNVDPGTMGENIATQGIDLLALPKGTVLRFGGGAEIEVTGLRNPCAQLDDYQTGLMQAVLDRDESGGLIRKAGVMGVVRTGGRVQAGDVIKVLLPDVPFARLECV